MSTRPLPQRLLGDSRCDTVSDDAVQHTLCRRVLEADAGAAGLHHALGQGVDGDERHQAHPVPEYVGLRDQIGAWHIGVDIRDPVERPAITSRMGVSGVFGALQVHHRLGGTNPQDAIVLRDGLGTAGRE